MKRIILLLLGLAAACCIYAKDNGLAIVKGGRTAYNIIYSSKGGEAARENAEQLAIAIQLRTGAAIDIMDDSSPATEYEIIIGPENSREESIALESEIKGFGYRLSRVGKKIVITGSDANHAVMALTFFGRELLGNEVYAGKKYFKFSDDEALSADFAQTQASLKNIVRNKWDHELSLRHMVKQMPEKGTELAQGVCCDGEHVYFVQKNREDNQARVYKYRMSDWTFLAKTEIFNGGHCNDLVWDAGNKRIICIKGGVNPELKEESVAIDPETMKVSEGPRIPEGATAIDYNPVLDRFITRHGMNLCQRDSSMEIIFRSKRTDDNTMLSQGMGSDDEYFYFPMSPNNKEIYNALLVYDWATGTYQGSLHIPLNYESESMFEHDGVYYVVFYHRGATLYRINPILKFIARL